MNRLLSILLTLSCLQFLPTYSNACINLIDDNLALYRPDRKSYLDSLAYAKTLKAVSSDKLIFHCFWRVPREFSVKQVAVLKSIIVSHQDHLDNLEVNLWSNVDLSENNLFKEVSDFVNLRRWDYSEEVKGTYLESVSRVNKDSLYDGLCYLEGDIFRLLVLHKYGGFYIDMDALVLRDMSPLNHLEFLYQWGTSGFNYNEPHILMNGAVMRLSKGSDLSFEFLEKVADSDLDENSFNLGTHLYSKITKNDLLVLPGVWFDSEWGFEGAFCCPFKKVKNFDLFDGAFAWHWHNRWDEPIEKGSKFDILQTQINKRFLELRAMTYGPRGGGCR